MTNVTSPPPQPPVQEIRLPWYVILGGMLVVTVVIMFTFSKPLDTTPPPEAELKPLGATPASQPTLVPTNIPAATQLE